MKLIVISGLSGAGKSLALHTLEDENVHCINNLPPNLLKHLIKQLADGDITLSDSVAISLDVRNLGGKQPAHEQFDNICALVKEAGITLYTVFFDCDNATLLARYTETRHTHPMSTQTKTLLEALNTERELLAPVRERCDLIIDTSRLNPHQCAQLVRESLCSTHTGITVILQSFAFRKGVPLNSSNIFDLRCLPNPYWDHELRPLNGCDARVADFFGRSDLCTDILGRIHDYLHNCLPLFEHAFYKYFTASLGCTGGMHRSVYAVEQLHAMLTDDGFTVVKHHRELN